MSHSMSTAGGCGNLECAVTHFVTGNNKTGECMHGHLSMQTLSRLIHGRLQGYVCAGLCHHPLDAGF